MQRERRAHNVCLNLPVAAFSHARFEGRDARAIARAIAHIHAHPFDALSLVELAGVAHLSRFHFSRMFRSVTGYSPMQYVRNLRIEYAKQMLREETSTVATVAAHLGFFDQSHFSRTFRRITGTTPGHFASRSGA